MTSEHSDENEYTPEILKILQTLWGDGMLSPGGREDLEKIVKGIDLRDKLVLDIGCAIGGFDVLLSKNYGARVIGLDIEAPLLELGRERVKENGLEGRVDLRLYEPGRLPFDDEHFDVVFGKDSWIHIEDKRSFFRDVFRVLKPGGMLVAGDWLRSDRPYNDLMRKFFELEGLTYHMDTLENYGAILRDTGFVDVSLVDIHEDYRTMAHKEYRQLRTTFSETLVRSLGQEQYDHFLENWRVLTEVVDAGDLRPGRLRAGKPAAAQGMALPG